MKATKRGTPSAAAARAAVQAATARRPEGPQLWHYGLAALVALVVVFVVYGPSMHGPFLLDDTYLPYAQPAYAHLPLGSWMQGVRPILMFSYWLNFQSGDQDTYGYHVVNVLLHLLNGGLIFLVIRKILGWAGAPKPTREILSVFAAGLFLLHPLQTESVSYIASRSESLSVFFFLAAFAVFVYRKSAGVSWVVAAAVLVLFGAACLTKEHAAVLPALLLLTDYYWNPGFSLQGIKRNWKLYVPIMLAAAAAISFVLRLLSRSNSAGFGLKDFTWYQYFFTECRAIWRYILFYVFPIGQNIDHDQAVSRTILGHGAIVALAGLVALIAAAWFYRRRFPLISYGVFAFLLLLAPTSSIIPIRDTLVERRMYLPFIGFLFVTVGLLCLWKPSGTTLIGTLAAVLLIAAGLSYRRNQLWGDAITMWSDSVSKSPAKYRPHFQLAYAYYSAGQCRQAVSEFARTAQLSKPDPGLLIDWGLAADCAGNPAEALSKLRAAAALDKTAHVYSQIGMEHAKLAQYPQALDALDIAARLDPNFEMTYVYRGNVYALQGNRRQAADDYQRALAIDPENRTARDGLIRLARQR